MPVKFVSPPLLIKAVRIIIPALSMKPKSHNQGSNLYNHQAYQDYLYAYHLPSFSLKIAGAGFEPRDLRVMGHSLCFHKSAS